MVSPKLKWELNQQIMCLYKGHKYEAKIIEANMNNSECVYKIHYKGWNSRYDEYLNLEEVKERFFEFTQVEANKQKMELNKIKKEKSIRKKPKEVKKIAKSLLLANINNGNIKPPKRRLTNKTVIDLPSGINNFKELTEIYLDCRKESRRGKFLKKFWTKANIQLNLKR